MEVVNPATLAAFDDDHPTGALVQRYLFQGTERSPDNFMFSLAQNVKRFQMLQHRHNFDQFRFTVSGDMNMGNGRVLREGWLGFFPEGASYGPQDDPAGPTALVLQFGGASGYGYMSPQQYRAGRAALNKKGRFEGAVFVRNDGEPGQKKKFSINAIWEEALGERLRIPTPRYDTPIFINPAAFRWVPQRSVPGAFRKALGTFSEREVSAELWKLEPGAALNLTSVAAVTLLYVVAGSGIADDQEIRSSYGVRLQPGESGSLRGREELTFLCFRLPLIEPGWSQPQAPSFEPLPGEAVPDALKEVR